MTKLPIYFLVDLSGDMDGSRQERVRTALNEFAEIVRQTPVLWGCEIWTSVVTLGDDVVQHLPLSEGASFESPELQFETTESSAMDSNELRRIVERDIDVDVTDRKALWKRKTHAPIAIVFSANTTKSGKALSSIFWKTSMVFLGREPEMSVSEESDDRFWDDFDRWWDWEPELGQELYDWIDLRLDMEADCVPEWMEEGWNEETEFAKRVFVVLDVSASMHGEPLQSMRNGVDGLMSALKSNPDTCEGTRVTAIAFSTHARVIVDSVPLDEFILPDIQTGGSTNISEAVDLLLSKAKAADAAEPPMVLFFMDGYPTDDGAESAILKFHSIEWGPCASFAVVGGAEKHFLARLTPRKVYDLCVNPNFNAAIQS